MTRTRSAAAAAIPLFAKGLHVLLVDEDLQNLTKMKFLLENNTYREDSTATALSMILGNECPYDIAIAEIAMPDIDGFKFLQQIRVQGSNFPIILMTANVEPNMEEKASDLGATMFLKKPVPECILVSIWENIPLQRLTPYERNGRISTFSSSRRNIHGGSGITNSSTIGRMGRKSKILWSKELQREFIAVVAELGEEKVEPQEIVKKMKMNNLNLNHVQISNYLQRLRTEARKTGISILYLMPNLVQEQVDIPSFFPSDAMHQLLFYPTSAMLIDDPMKELISSVPDSSMDKENPLDWKAVAQEVGIPFDDIGAFVPKDSHQLTWCLDDLPNFLY